MGAFPSWAPSARTCQIPTPYLQAHGQRVVGLAGVALGEEDHELVIFLSGVVERGYCFCSRADSHGFSHVLFSKIPSGTNYKLKRIHDQ
jgi:hypothetical protein